MKKRIFKGKAVLLSVFIILVLILLIFLLNFTINGFVTYDNLEGERSKGITGRVSFIDRVIDFFTGGEEDEEKIFLQAPTSEVELHGMCFTVEINGNGIDDDCDGVSDETDGLAIDSRITNEDTHATKTTAFWAAGELVDRVDMGYIHWNSASGDTFDPDGDTDDRDNSFGEHNGKKCGSVGAYSFFYSGCAVEWDFQVPEPGYYVLSFFSWSSASRQITPSYENGLSKVTLPNSDKWIDMYLVYFHSAGPKRISAWGNSGTYLFHSQLYKLREDPVPSFGLHPRLGVNPGNISEFRDRLNRGWIKLFRDDTLADANSLIAGDLNVYNQCSSRDHESRIGDLAVAYLATGDTRYADFGIEALRRVVSQPHWMCGPAWSYLELGELTLTTALGYDAFFDRMSQEQKEEIFRNADRHINYLFINSVNAEHRGDSSHWWSDTAPNNWNPVINGGGLGTAAIAFKGDNKYASQWLSQAVKTNKRFLDNAFDSDGAYAESFMYLNYALTASLFYQSLLESEGIDFITYNDNYLKKAAYTNLYFFEPSKWDESPFDDMTRWPLLGSDGNPVRYQYVGPPESFWFLAAKFYKDGVLQRHIRSVYGDLRPTDRYHDYSGYLPLSLLLYGEVQDIPPSEWNIPLGKVWPGFGRVVMRTGFEDINDYYFAMQSGLYGSHGQADQSSFIIHALGQVLVDDDGYGTKNSSYHNVILVDGQGQKESGDKEFHGSVDSFLHTDVMDYALADSTLGYVKNGVAIDSNRRNVLFVRPSGSNDGYFVMADHVKSSISHTYDWGLHHQKDAAVIENLGSNNYRFDSSGAYLAITGKEADLEIQFASPSSSRYTVSGNKLVITPNEPLSEEHFVVLLYPTDTVHLLPTVNKIGTSAFSGFQIKDDLILYNKPKGLNTYETVETDAELVFLRNSANSKLMSLYGGTRLKDDGLNIYSSVATNIVLVQEINDYKITLGDEAVDEGEAILTLGGIADGDYTYLLDGSHQGTATAIGGSLTLSLALSKHVIELTYQGISPGNQDPIANAGGDQTLDLAAGQTSLTVTLDGSGSYDPDGTIVSYVWSGTPDPADVISPTVSLAEGIYAFNLTVTDDQGATATDSVLITIRAPPPITQQQLDAEIQKFYNGQITIVDVSNKIMEFLDR